MICRLCRGEALSLYYTQGNHEEFKFYKCADCGLVNYDLAGGLNQEKYAGSYPDPKDDSLKTNRTQTLTFRFITDHLPERGRILDIGCGNGRLLKLFRDRGWEVHGLELSPVLARQVRDTLDIPVEAADFLEYQGERERFDVVVLRHVLEHLPSPQAAMNRLNALLRPGGHAVLEFPNIEAWELKLKRWLSRRGWRRKTYRADYKPGHCNEFCRGSFALLAEQTGFRVRVWETYSYKPVLNWIYNRVPVGSKARVILEKTEASGGAAHRP